MDRSILRATLSSGAKDKGRFLNRWKGHGSKKSLVGIQPSLVLSNWGKTLKIMVDWLESPDTTKASSHGTRPGPQICIDVICVKKDSS